MAIIFHEKTNTFHLTNKDVSYLIRIMENGQLENLYYGKALKDREDYSYMHEEEPRSQMSISMPEPSTLSMHYTRQEYPVYGTGDYRSPAFSVLQENGSRITNYVYASHSIFAGKKSLEPLPSTYVESDSEAATLEITLHDQVTDTDLTLSYTLYENYPVITRNARFLQKAPRRSFWNAP